MINANQTLKCPTCNGNIQIDVKQLLEGVQFYCPTCSCVIGIRADAINKIKDMKLPEAPTRSGGKK